MTTLEAAVVLGGLAFFWLDPMDRWRRWRARSDIDRDLCEWAQRRELLKRLGGHR